MSGIRVDTLRTQDGSYSVEVIDLATRSGDLTLLTETVTDGFAAVNTSLLTKVDKTSDKGSVKVPAGSNADRDGDGAPQPGWTHFSEESKRLEVYNGTEWVPVGSGTGAMFEYTWHNGPRSTLSGGFVPADGQKILAVDNPRVCADIWANKQNAVIESAWEANQHVWSKGDGTTYVRVPNLNMADGSGKPFYLRGGPDSLNGTWASDAIKAHGHRIHGASINQGSSAGYQIAMVYSPAGAGDKTGLNNYPVNAYRDDFVVEVTGTTPADENRVKTAYGVWAVRVLTDVANTGSIDAAQLASQVSSLDAQLQTLQGKYNSELNFAIVYPNGGTAASPASVSVNSTYTTPNPFAGKHVILEAQVLYGGVWSPASWFTNNTAAVGVVARVKNNEIVVITGTTGNIGRANIAGNAFGNTGADVATPVPCRVLVWHVKGNV